MVFKTAGVTENVDISAYPKLNDIMKKIYKDIVVCTDITTLCVRN